VKCIFLIWSAIGGATGCKGIWQPKISVLFGRKMLFVVRKLFWATCGASDRATWGSFPRSFMAVWFPIRSFALGVTIPAACRI
jgi:hypothetical protein